MAQERSDLRRLRTLRISLTSRCDLACAYCDTGPEPGPELSADEAGRLAEAARVAGATTVRLTGGEPLLREDLDDIVGRVRASGIRDVALTTNARRLAPCARRLVAAGLARVNIGLPSLDAATYRAMTGGELAPALEGLEAALEAGLAPVKLNVVLVRGANDRELASFVELARSRPVEVRFVERMPFSDANGLVSAAEVREGLARLVGGESLGEPSPSPTAWVYSPKGFTGKLGLVPPVTEPFCDRCDRLRATSDGRLRACLSEPLWRDVRPMLSAGAAPAVLAREMLDCFAAKPGRHSGTFAGPMRTMGG